MIDARNSTFGPLSAIQAYENALAALRELQAQQATSTHDASEFHIALIRELADTKQSLLATENQLATSKRMLANALKEAWGESATQPAQQAQKPVGTVGCDDYAQHPNVGTLATLSEPLLTGTKLYTAPSHELVQQARKPVQFLCDATRFKVRQHEGRDAAHIFGLPSELNGRWVALVAAEDDCHLALTPAAPSRPMVQQVRDALTQVHGDFHLMPGRVGPQEAFLMAREAIAALNKWLEVNP